MNQELKAIIKLWISFYYIKTPLGDFQAKPSVLTINVLLEENPCLFFSIPMCSENLLENLQMGRENVLHNLKSINLTIEVKFDQNHIWIFLL
jgi:hypothetical protein